MERHQIESKLTPMVGKAFTYRRDKFILLEFTVSMPHVKLSLDDREEEMVIHKDDFRQMIDQFYPAQKDLIVVPPARESNAYLDKPTTAVQDRMAKTLIGQNANWIADTIKKNIVKVQEDPGYIAQAVAVNDQVKTFVDVCKTEVEMLKAINRVDTTA